MITKRIKEGGKLFTKDVNDYLKSMLDVQGDITITIFNEKAISKPFFEEARSRKNHLKVRTTKEFKGVIDKLNLDNIKHERLKLDLSKRMHAIYSVEGQKYVVVTSKYIIAADRSEYPEGVDLVKSILGYARELK